MHEPKKRKKSKNSKGLKAKDQIVGMENARPQIRDQQTHVFNLEYWQCTPTRAVLNVYANLGFSAFRYFRVTSPYWRDGQTDGEMDGQDA